MKNNALNQATQKPNFGIIGYGRFGKLWAKCLKPFGKVFIYKKTDSVKKLQQTINADFLFLLVPISQIADVCKQIKKYLSPKTVVVDACSVKEYPVQMMKKYLPKKQPIIATHPLFGPDSVKQFGLKNQRIVVCPVSAPKNKFTIFLGVLKKMQLEIIKTTEKHHDEQMAISQALVHFIGRGLEPLLLKKQKISTPNYESLLRLSSMVTNDTFQLFIDMQCYNKHTQKVRKKFVESLQKINSKL
ncbi:prephenate dehydrogenase [Candidatus Peregrinibacteria bacterium]|nr:prephenate dehydrogenase [Candidatus Peregrinibacteria bacterium]